MRKGFVRTVPALVLAGALVGSLAACSSPFGSAECTPIVPVGVSAGYVSATGAFAAPPTVGFPTPLRTEGAQRATIDAGEGEAILPGQIVDFQVSVFNGQDGELITQSAYDDAQEPLRRTAGSDTDLLAQAVQCATVNSRFAVTGTVAEVFGAGALDPALGLRDNDALVIVVDVEAAYLAKATGTAQRGASGIPAVVTTSSGIPGVTIPDEEPPTELRAHTLVLGDGAVLKEGDRAVLHYTGLLWGAKSVFDSSWNRGAPATFTLASFLDDPNGVVPGLAQGLIGQRVGSQVIVVIPPELGYPDGQAPSMIPSGSTMVFVVDLLGVEG